MTTSTALVLVSLTLPKDCKDLYACLGITSKATLADIKNAYRRLSAIHHPDKGGDPALFQIISHAYLELSDPKTKAFYDETGVEKPSEEALNSEAQNMLEQKMVSIINTLASTENPAFANLWNFDLVDILRQGLLEDKQQAKINLTKVRSVRTRYEGLRKRLKKKNGSFSSTPMGMVIEENLSNLKHAIFLQLNTIEVCDLAMAKAKDFEYDTTSGVTPGQTTYATFTIGGRQFGGISTTWR